MRVNNIQVKGIRDTQHKLELMIVDVILILKRKNESTAEGSFNFD